MASNYFCSQIPAQNDNGVYSESWSNSFYMESSQEQVWVAIPKAELEALKSNQEEMKSLILNNKKEEYLNRWVESGEARKQLKVSERTWQRMRNERVIPFSQFGRKIYFRQSDIEAFLNSNLITSVQ